MHGLDTSNVSSRVESSQVEFEPMCLYAFWFIFTSYSVRIDVVTTGTVACSSSSIKVLPVADDESCEVKVNGNAAGALNAGATLVRIEVKSPDRSNSQVVVFI